MSDSNLLGKWVKVSDRTPTTPDIKITMTENKIMGLASFVDDEWIQLLPTFMGDVYMWCEFIGEDGEPILFELPEPELVG